MPIASTRAHGDAIIARLTAAAAGTSVLIGDAEKPGTRTEDTRVAGWTDAYGQSVFVPYIIVYPLTAEFDGPLGDPDADAEFAWQCTCVGSTREQAQGIEDLAIEAFVGQTLTVTGRSVRRIRLEDGGGGVRPDESVQPPLYISTPRFAAYSTPA
jgi:hypothetical protein